jgi:hypothetical protein
VFGRYGSSQDFEKAGRIQVCLWWKAGHLSVTLGWAPSEPLSDALAQLSGMILDQCSNLKKPAPLEPASPLDT